MLPFLSDVPSTSPLHIPNIPTANWPMSYLTLGLTIFYFPATSKAMQSIITFTLNCRGLNAKVKAKKTIHLLTASYADIVFLQETHLQNDKSKVFWSSKFPIQFHAPGSSKACGVVILFLANLRVIIGRQLSDSVGRFLFLNIHIDTHTQFCLSTALMLIS